MQVVLFFLEVILCAGAIVPAILVVAHLAWFFGLRDPFLLTVTALGIGGAAGWALNIVIGKLGGSDQPDEPQGGAPATPGALPPRSQSDK